MLTKRDITEIFDIALKPIKKDISAIKNDVNGVHKELKKLTKAEAIASKYFDITTTGHDKRLKDIEKHLNLRLLVD